MLSEGRREGLRLALNRSLSEPGEASGEATVRCPVSLPQLMAPQVVSMPASPCGESATIQRSLLLRRARALQPAEVARKLTKTKPRNFLLVDLRPFISYNLRHVRSAINLNCSDRFNRKRLQLRRASVVDLAVSPSGRDLLKKRCYKEIIVYDDATSDLEALPPTHPVYLVLTALLEDNREPLLLKGEYISVFLSPKLVFVLCRTVTSQPFSSKPQPVLPRPSSPAHSHARSYYLKTCVLSQRREARLSVSLALLLQCPLLGATGQPLHGCERRAGTARLWESVFPCLSLECARVHVASLAVLLGAGRCTKVGSAGGASWRKWLAE